MRAYEERRYKLFAAVKEAAEGRSDTFKLLDAVLYALIKICPTLSDAEARKITLLLVNYAERQLPRDPHAVKTQKPKPELAVTTR